MYDDDALIDLVQKFSFLYDKTHRWYKNKNEIEKGWTKIGDILNMTSEECEQRWIILRNRFCTEMRKEKSSPTGSALRPWPLYEDLSWLKPHVIPRNPRRKIMHNDVRLIDLVHQYSFLYDKTHKWFKNEEEREKGWTTIADTLKITSEVCEQRWGLLRNRFCTELRKENNSQIDSAPRQIWPLFENLIWLKPHVIPRRKIMHYDVRLIDLVHQYSFLYDKTHEWFKNEEEREKGWITIADTLKITPEECEQRWGLLRNRFCTELRKENNSQIGSAPRQIWPLFENLIWLRPHVIPRRSSGIIPAPKLPDDWETSFELETTTECIAELDEGTDIKYIITQPDDICETLYSHPADCSPEQSSRASCSESPVKRPKPNPCEAGDDSRFVKKSKTDEILGDALTGALSQLTEIIRREGKQSKDQRNDPDDLFGTMVAQYLKEIKDVKKKVLVKSDILRVFENIL